MGKRGRVFSVLRRHLEKIPGVLGMQSGLNSVSMPVGVMEMALYSSYTPR
jgi:hypothetical protein